MHTPQRPYISIDSQVQVCHSGWTDIGQALKTSLQQHRKKRLVLTVECHPGTYTGLDLAGLKKALEPDVICQSDDLFLDEQELSTTFRLPEVPTNYPSASPVEVGAFFDQAKLKALRQTIENLSSGLILVHGVGAHHVWPSDVLVYFDVSRWELVQRMRRQEVGNVGFSNKHIPLQKRFLRSYFVDWPLTELIKQQVLPECHFYLEANNWQQPKLIEGSLLRTGLAEASTQPLFMAPFFDPEIWNLSDSPPEKPLSASFDLHPGNDNFLLKAGGELIEIPARNLLYLFPESMLGTGNEGTQTRIFPFTLTHQQQFHKREHLIFWHPDPAYFGTPAKDRTSTYQHLIMLEAKTQATLLAGFNQYISSDQQRIILQQDVPKQVDWLTHLQRFQLSRYECLSIPHSMIHSVGVHGEVLRISRVDEHWRQRIPQRLQDEAKIFIPTEQITKTPENALSPVRWSLDTEASPVDQFCAHRQLIDKHPTPIPHTGVYRVVCHLKGDDVYFKHQDGATTRLHTGQLLVLPAAYQGATWRSNGRSEVMLLRNR